MDPESARLSSALTAEVQREQQLGTGPWIGTDGTTPIYVVPADQHLVNVALDDPTATWRVSLAAAFAQVPVPDGARPATGSDGHMTIWQPSTDRLWDFFQARHDATGWHAAWGGAIDHVSTSPGYFSPCSWPGAASSWGSTASSLPMVAGVMRISELLGGHIDHALAMDVPNPRNGVWAWPAQRTDGTNTAADALPEGAHLRLDPSLDISALGLPPMVRMMADAAQKYGIIVRDRTDWAIGFSGESPQGADPYYGAAGLFGGQWPGGLLARFPWDHLQVLRMDLHGG